MLDWWHHRGDKNDMFIKYEDMKIDMFGNVSRIASFLETEILHDTIENIAKQTAFSNTKKNSFCKSPWNQSVCDRSETDFMRKGIVSHWKNFLSPEQSTELDALCATKLIPARLEFKFE